MQIHLCPVSPAYSVWLWLALALLDRQPKGALASQDFDIGVSASQHLVSQRVCFICCENYFLELHPGYRSDDFTGSCSWKKYSCVYRCGGRSIFITITFFAIESLHDKGDPRKLDSGFHKHLTIKTLLWDCNMLLWWVPFEANVRCDQSLKHLFRWIGHILIHLVSLSIEKSETFVYLIKYMAIDVWFSSTANLHWSLTSLRFIRRVCDVFYKPWYSQFWHLKERRRG